VALVVTIPGRTRHKANNKTQKEKESEKETSHWINGPYHTARGDSTKALDHQRQIKDLDWV